MTARKNFFLFLFSHDDESCPNYEEDPSKRLTPDKLSYEDSNETFENRMARLRNEFPCVNSYEVIHECEFRKMLESPSPTQLMVDFKEKVLPGLIFFERLSPRESCFGGTTELVQMKWQQHQNLNEALEFIDINSAHSYCMTLRYFTFSCNAK